MRQTVNHLVFFKNAEVTAEVAVGESAELFEVVEGQALGVRDERGENAEPRALVDDAIKAFIGETALGCWGA
jgi:hypothetical protein